MKRISILLLAALAAGPAAAATTPRGLVVDDLTLSAGNQWRQGALLVRAEVRNPTASDQRVRIRYGDAKGSYSYGLTEASSDLVVPAGGRSLCEFALPHVRHSGTPRLVAIDGSGRETVVTERASDFRLVEQPFTCDQAKCEAERCLQCDLRLTLTPVKLWNKY